MELEPINLIDFLRGKSGIAALEESIKVLEQQMSQIKQHAEEYRPGGEKYAAEVARYNALDGYSFEARAKQILKGFGFKESDFTRNCALFSGGWKMRVLLPRSFFRRPTSCSWTNLPITWIPKAWNGWRAIFEALQEQSL